MTVREWKDSMERFVPDPDSPLTAEHNAFHAHLDVCSRCRDRPFDLCAKGYALLVAAAASIKIRQERAGA